MSLPSQNNKAGPGAYFALAFAAVFFSGLLGGKEWYGVFDFTTLNGAFGKVVSKASLEGDTLTTATSAFRGTGGHGAMDGFLFALGLIPAVMFALGMINVLEHYGALRAARRLLPVRQSRFDNKLAKHAGLGERSFVKAARGHLVELGGVTTEAS